MSEFYERLDRIEQENRIKRIFKDRPADLHDYQGCVNDPSMEPVASPVTLSGETLKFCMPSDRQPQYLLMYDDPEVGFSLFDSKEDAMMAFAAANIGWDVWLFEPVAVTLSEGQDTQEKKS